MAQLELEISPPAVRPQAQAIVDELVEELRELGHEPTVVPGFEQRSAFQPIEVVVWLVERVGDEAIGAIVAVTVGWIRRTVRGRRGRRPHTVKVILKPNGEVLREVEVDLGPSEDA